jgi:rubrerythrin
MSEVDERLYAGLDEAFVAEATAVARYTYFAEVARIEGYAETHAHFRDLSESTSRVSHGHLDLLQQVADPTTGRPTGETSLNLRAAVTGEPGKATELYPRLVGTAHASGPG